MDATAAPEIALFNMVRRDSLVMVVHHTGEDEAFNHIRR
jgi:AmiR/NasT family two-component response regulator